MSINCTRESRLQSCLLNTMNFIISINTYKENIVIYYKKTTIYLEHIRNITFKTENKMVTTSITSKKSNTISFHNCKMLHFQKNGLSIMLDRR